MERVIQYFCHKKRYANANSNAVPEFDVSVRPPRSLFSRRPSSTNVALSLPHSLRSSPPFTLRHEINSAEGSVGAALRGKLFGLLTIDRTPPSRHRRRQRPEALQKPLFHSHNLAPRAFISKSKRCPQRILEKARLFLMNVFFACTQWGLVIAIRRQPVSFDTAFDTSATTSVFHIPTHPPRPVCNFNSWSGRTIVSCETIQCVYTFILNTRNHQFVIEHVRDHVRVVYVLDASVRIGTTSHIESELLVRCDKPFARQ